MIFGRRGVVFVGLQGLGLVRSFSGAGADPLLDVLVGMVWFLGDARVFFFLQF